MIFLAKRLIVTKNQTPPFDWKEFTLKTVALILVSVSVILFFIFLITCIVYFVYRGGSPSLVNLGLYGDFFGGIVGGITSVATLGVTIYLALVLHRLERENTESTIQGQRKVALMQAKLNEFALFHTQCESEMQTLSSTIEDHEGTYRAYKSILNTCFRLTTLFPELDSSEKYFEFRLFATHLMLLSEASKELNLKMSEGQPSDVIEDLLRKMFDRFDATNKEYHKLVKKLSDWALE